MPKFEECKLYVMRHADGREVRTGDVDAGVQLRDQHGFEKVGEIPGVKITWSGKVYYVALELTGEAVLKAAGVA